MSRLSPRVHRSAIALGAPLLAAVLLASLASTAAGAPVAHRRAPGYQVLVTSAPGTAKPATVLAAGTPTPAAPFLRLRLGGGDLAVPLASRAGSAPRSFAVTAVAHAGRGGITGPGSAPARTLTVKGTDLAGQPASSGLVLVGNVNNANAAGTGIGGFTNGTATFQVQPGTFWALALLPQFTGKTLTSMRMVVLPQFQVSGDTTVRARAAAATDQVTMATPRPATTASLSLTVVRAAPGAPPSVTSSKVSSLMEQVSGATLWVNPVSQAPGYGSLRVFTSAQLTSPAGQQVPYAYDLNFASPPGTIGPQQFTVQPSSLATDADSYIQDTRTVAAWITEGGTRYQISTSFIGGLVFPLRTPTRQVQYLSAVPAMLWQTFYAEYRAIRPGQSAGGQTSAFRSPHPDRRLSETWNAYPLHPAGNVSFPGNPASVRSSADRAGNTLNLDVTPFSDNQPGHLGAGLTVDIPGKTSQVSGRYAVYQDGTKIASGDAVKAAGGFGDVQVHATLGSKPSLVKFVLTASRASAQYPQSATSHDVWTWHTRPQTGASIPAPWLCDFSVPGAKDRQCAVQPMITLGYHVAGLGLDGTTGPGKQSVAITAGHIQLAPRIPVATASVQMSVDGGQTWQPAEVISQGAGRFLASFTAAGGATVSLRVTARDSAGNGLTETILDAYRTSA